MTAILSKIFPCMFAPAAAPTETELKAAQLQKDKEKFAKGGFPEEICEKFPACARFLIDSGVLFSIAMFKNGPQEHDIRLDHNGHPLMKMNGNWERWEHIESRLDYDKATSRLISKDQSDIGWNYISPDGFVQKDVYNYDEIYPVEQLLKNEYESLLKHAEKFWEKHPEVDPDQKKECIFQITTTHRKNWGPLHVSESTWWTENLMKNMPGHSSIRIIDSEGKVYAFGTLMPDSESDTTSAPFFLTSAQVNITTPDYEEARPDFEARRVTSWPMTDERKEAILKFVSEANKAGIRFNFLRQPCVKVNTVIAQKAGVTIDAKTTMCETLGSILPSISKLPVISHIIAAVDKVKEVVSPFFETVAAYTPEPIKNFFSFIGSGFDFVARKINTVAANAFIWLLGGSRMSRPQWGIKKHDAHIYERKLDEFDCLINSVDDLFDEDLAAASYPSSKLERWQDEQPSTVTYTYEGTKMYLLPPETK
ncbi:MAG: hypothetical protein JSR46_03905 [Verrucomicrobia bacterium]|nr:hypothetical protein [Verrucomicrobiota bacterium]